MTEEINPAILPYDAAMHLKIGECFISSEGETLESILKTDVFAPKNHHQKIITILSILIKIKDKNIDLKTIHNYRVQYVLGSRDFVRIIAFRQMNSLKINGEDILKLSNDNQHA